MTGSNHSLFAEKVLNDTRDQLDFRPAFTSRHSVIDALRPCHHNTPEKHHLSILDRTIHFSKNSRFGFRLFESANRGGEGSRKNLRVHFWLCTTVHYRFRPTSNPRLTQQVAFDAGSSGHFNLFEGNRKTTRRGSNRLLSSTSFVTRIVELSQLRVVQLMLIVATVKAGGQLFSPLASRHQPLPISDAGRDISGTLTACKSRDHKSTGVEPEITLTPDITSTSKDT